MGKTVRNSGFMNYQSVNMVFPVFDQHGKKIPDRCMCISNANIMSPADQLPNAFLVTAAKRQIQSWRALVNEKRDSAKKAAAGKGSGSVFF